MQVGCIYSYFSSILFFIYMYCYIPAYHSPLSWADYVVPCLYETLGTCYITTLWYTWLNHFNRISFMGDVTHHDCMLNQRSIFISCEAGEVIRLVASISLFVWVQWTYVHCACTKSTMAHGIQSEISVYFSVIRKHLRSAFCTGQSHFQLIRIFTVVKDTVMLRIKHDTTL